MRDGRGVEVDLQVCVDRAAERFRVRGLRRRDLVASHLKLTREVRDDVLLVGELVHDDPPVGLVVPEEAEVHGLRLRRSRRRRPPARAGHGVLLGQCGEKVARVHVGRGGEEFEVKRVRPGEQRRALFGRGHPQLLERHRRALAVRDVRGGHREAARVNGVPAELHGAVDLERKPRHLLVSPLDFPEVRPSLKVHAVELARGNLAYRRAAGRGDVHASGQLASRQHRRHCRQRLGPVDLRREFAARDRLELLIDRAGEPHRDPVHQQPGGRHVHASGLRQSCAQVQLRHGAGGLRKHISVPHRRVRRVGRQRDLAGRGAPGGQRERNPAGRAQARRHEPFRQAREGVKKHGPFEVCLARHALRRRNGIRAKLVDVKPGERKLVLEPHFEVRGPGVQRRQVRASGRGVDTAGQRDPAGRVDAFRDELHRGENRAQFVRRRVQLDVEGSLKRGVVFNRAGHDARCERGLQVQRLDLDPPRAQVGRQVAQAEQFVLRQDIERRPHGFGRAVRPALDRKVARGKLERDGELLRTAAESAVLYNDRAARCELRDGVYICREARGQALKIGARVEGEVHVRRAREVRRAAPHRAVCVWRGAIAGLKTKFAVGQVDLRAARVESRAERERDRLTRPLLAREYRIGGEVGPAALALARERGFDLVEDLRQAKRLAELAAERAPAEPDVAREIHR